jgi:hypothetical protein
MVTPDSIILLEQYDLCLFDLCDSGVSRIFFSCVLSHVSIDTWKHAREKYPGYATAVRERSTSRISNLTRTDTRVNRRLEYHAIPLPGAGKLIDRRCES